MSLLRIGKSFGNEACFDNFCCIWSCSSIFSLFSGFNPQFLSSTRVSFYIRYATDYGMFRFCVANTELDWREGTEQYKFIEHCLSSVDRQKQPWLIFLAHRVLGYSSCTFYAEQGSSSEPMGRESLQSLWQKYKVDLAIYGHVHSYERTCPIYQVFLNFVSTKVLFLHVCCCLTRNIRISFFI